MVAMACMLESLWSLYAVIPDDKKWKKMYFQERKLVQTNEDRLRRLKNEVYRRIGTMPTTSQQETPIRGSHNMLGV